MLSLVGSMTCLCVFLGLLGLAGCLILPGHWTCFTAGFYGIRLGHALCKVTGFYGAVAARLKRRYDKH